MINHLEMRTGNWGVRSNLRTHQNENMLNFDPIIPFDHFEMRSGIWGVRSSLGSDQNKKMTLNFNAIIPIDNF